MEVAKRKELCIKLDKSNITLHYGIHINCPVSVGSLSTVCTAPVTAVSTTLRDTYNSMTFVIIVIIKKK